MDYFRLSVFIVFLGSILLIYFSNPPNWVWGMFLGLQAWVLLRTTEPKNG